MILVISNGVLSCCAIGDLIVMLVINGIFGETSRPYVTKNIG